MLLIAYSFPANEEQLTKASYDPRADHERKIDVLAYRLGLCSMISSGYGIAG